MTSRFPALVTFVVLCALNAPGVLGPTATCHAADFNDFQTWWDITTTYKFNDRWRYDGDQGTRGIVSNEEWTIAYVRPSVRFDVRRWFLMHGGVGLIYTFQSFPGDRFEIRPWVGFRFIWPRPGGFVFSHYFRFEDRFNYSEFRGTWDEAFRGRYQLGVKTPVFSVAGAGGFYGVTGIEFFKDLSGAIFERFANRGRLSVGLGKGFGESLRGQGFCPSGLAEASPLLVRLAGQQHPTPRSGLIDPVGGADAEVIRVYLVVRGRAAGAEHHLFHIHVHVGPQHHRRQFLAGPR